MLTDAKKLELKKLALQIRIATLETLKARGFGHVGGTRNKISSVYYIIKPVLSILRKHFRELVV